MNTVWIVFHDSSPNNTILGVFDNEQEAYEFLEIVGPEYPNGAYLSDFDVPWKRAAGTEIQIS